MLDFIKDIFGALRQNSIERIKSPVLGAFVFSWLGFNWQLLAVIFMSKEDVFLRLKYINDNFGIEKLLVGPILTTALICILLPIINKKVIELQKETLHKSNELLLKAKMDIAGKQLELADEEAKKRLADERQRKYLSNDIERIKSENDSLKSKNDDLNAELKSILSSLSKNIATSDERGKNIEGLKSEIDKIRTESNDVKSSLARNVALLESEVEKNKKLIIEMQLSEKNTSELREKLKACESSLSEKENGEVINSRSYQRFTEDKLEKVYRLANESITGLIVFHKENSSTELPGIIKEKIDEMSCVYENKYAKGVGGFL